MHRWWEIVLCGIVVQCLDLGGEHTGLGVHGRNDARNVADGEGVECNTNHHPEQTKDKFSFRRNGKVTVPNRCDCLKRPVKSLKVLV